MLQCICVLSDFQPKLNNYLTLYSVVIIVVYSVSNIFPPYADVDIGQITFDANAPEPQNKSFLFDNKIALEIDTLFTLGIRDPVEVGIAEPSQMIIIVVDDNSNTQHLTTGNYYYMHAKLHVHLLM